MASCADILSSGCVTCLPVSSTLHRSDLVATVPEQRHHHSAAAAAASDALVELNCVFLKAVDCGGLGRCRCHMLAAMKMLLLCGGLLVQVRVNTMSRALTALGFSQTPPRSSYQVTTCTPYMPLHTSPQEASFHWHGRPKTKEYKEWMLPRGT